MHTAATPLMWGCFIVLILGMLALDLGVFNRRAHVVEPREALRWTVIWIGLSLAFNAFVYFRFGPTLALEFLTGYLIEKALSVDNIFVFLVIFSYFSVPRLYQHRILFWGVLGAIVLRAIFIVLGAAMLERFHWVLFLFGGFLILSGIKIILQREGGFDPSRNLVVRLFERYVPLVRDCRGGHFFLVRDGRRYATPLLLVLLVVEATDVVFAVDSIPAIFAVTMDPFIIFTSNIFAILGLRSLYFLLSDVVGRYRFLKVGLGAVLAFVGVKMLISDWYKIPIGVSLTVIILFFGGSILASKWIPAPPPKLRDDAPRRVLFRRKGT